MHKQLKLSDAAPTQNEKAVKDQIKKILTATAKCWWFMPPANGYGRSGIPDFVGEVNGCLFAVEAKSGRGKTTAHQVREIEAIMQAGGKVWIVREETLNDFKAEFAGWAAVCS